MGGERTGAEQRTRRPRVWVAVATCVLVVVAIVAFGAVASGLFGESGAAEDSAVGVARSGRSVEIVVCRSQIIDSVEITRAGEYEPIVWSARRTGAGSSSIPVSDRVTGYQIDAAAIPLHQHERYAVQRLKGAGGVSLTAHVLDFEPDSLRPGQILDGTGTFVTEASFKAACQ